MENQVKKSMKIALFNLGIIFSLSAMNAHAGSVQIPANIDLILRNAADPSRVCDDPKVPAKPAAVPVVDGSSSDFATEQMVKTAYTFYNKPYPNDPGEMVTQNDLKVYRPNHGIAHSVRSAVIASDMVKMLLADPTANDTQTWLKAKIKADPEFLKKISLMALLHRSGREDEGESRPEELTAGAANFKVAAAASGLHFSASDLENFSNSIILDGKGSPNVDQDHLSHLLRAAHVVDLIRDGYQLQSQVSGFVPDLNAAEVKKLYQNEDNYLKTTGDQRQAGSGYTDAFYKLSTNPQALLQAVLKTQKDNSAQ